MKDIRAITIAEAFYDVFITRYGVPKRLITDRGSQFTSIMFEKLNDLLKIKHRFTTSYHPQTNGVVERVNREISKSLAILVNQEGLEWTKLLQSVAFAFRTSYHSVLGLSPYKLLFGRDPSLPTDVFFNIDDEENFGDFSTEVQERIQESHQIMVKNQETFDKRIKAYYDRTHKAVSFAPRDFVMLFTDKYLQGNRKFQTRFSGPYVVIEQVSPVNVILQHPETGHEKRVHVLRIRKFKNRPEALQMSHLPQNSWRSVQPVHNDSVNHALSRSGALNGRPSSRRVAVDDTSAHSRNSGALNRRPWSDPASVGNTSDCGRVCDPESDSVPDSPLMPDNPYDFEQDESSVADEYEIYSSNNNEHEFEFENNSDESSSNDFEPKVLQRLELGGTEFLYQYGPRSHEKQWLSPADIPVQCIDAFYHRNGVTL